jgi:CheY-specific phosphatase CheX
MSTATIDLKEWLDALSEVTRDFAKGTLRFERGAPGEEFEAADGSSPAVYIAILGDRTSIHLGISTTSAGSRALVRALLGMRSTEPIEEKEVVDGLSEILNILAGKVKSRMSPRDHSLRLGLPMYIVGQIQMTANMEKSAADVRLGPVPCQILVFRNRR